MKVLCVIPARGGSKGIPRKNLRPLAGKPLIYYSINAALNADTVDSVLVSTDDEEIALFARRFGARVLMRPKELADDHETLDPVILQATEEDELLNKLSYKTILTVQPTSPLICSSDIDSALGQFNESTNDSLISVVDDRHLCWTIDKGKPQAVYNERVNRQSLPSNYRETGSIIVCSREQLDKGTRIGNDIGLFIMEHERSFDIDSLTDLFLCESILTHKRIVFTVIGSREYGLGHAYRALMLAHELVRYDIHFICEEKDDLAISYISAHNYNVHKCNNGNLLETVISLAPDMVINDILDTEDTYISILKKKNFIVVNFEDMGKGAEKANLVINALYPHQLPSSHVLVGPDYFCLRDEFIYLPKYEFNNAIKRVLITFGGVDEGNLTLRTLKLIFQHCNKIKINIDIIVGSGYVHQEELLAQIKIFGDDLIKFNSSTSRISDFMIKADLAITSGGRTVLELTALQIPTIVICQNQRETLHTYASSDNGIINLGYRKDVTDDMISDTFTKLTIDKNLRLLMREKMTALDLTQGKKRVIKKITELFGQDA